jgi:REP element-mobilizing transposase RayT
MPREPRAFFSGVAYHLISRFVDREWIIKTSDERRLYLTLLGRQIETSDWRLFSYAVMSNHVHLGVVAGAQPVDSWIRGVHAPFADAMNRAYNRIGNVFVRGPKAYPVARGSVGRLIAYIHNNPVRAGLCVSPSESDWTSHRAYLSARPPRWLDVDLGLALADSSQRDEFDRWVRDPERVASEHEFSEEHHELELATVRTACRAQERPAVHLIAEVTAELVGVAIAQLRSPSSRGHREVLARRAAVHCASIVGHSAPHIAGALCISQQRVSVIRREQLQADVLEVSARVLERCAVGLRPGSSRS